MITDKGFWTPKDCQNFIRFIEENGGTVLEHWLAEYLRPSYVFVIVPPDNVTESWGQNMMRQYESLRQ